MTSIKKWVTKKTGYEGADSFFPTKTKAVAHARKLLMAGGKKSEGFNPHIHIGKFSEEKYREGKMLRQCYDTVEIWHRQGRTLTKEIVRRK